MIKAKVLKDIDFLYEVGALRNIRRGWDQLANTEFQNFPEHIFRTAWIALLLSRRIKKTVDTKKVLKMAFCYSLLKTRCSDFHYISYDNISQNREKAFEDIFMGTSLYKQFIQVEEEYYERESLESIIVFIANGIENRLELKELASKGLEISEIWGKLNDRYIQKDISLPIGKKYWDSCKKSDPHNWHLSSENRFNFKITKYKKHRGIPREIDFLYEIGSLRLIPRTWTNFVGDRFASLIEHSFRVTWVSILLSTYERKVDLGKVILMAMIHDLPEIRSGDANYLTRYYLKRDKRTALEQTLKGICVEKEILELFDEFERQRSNEAKIVRDADYLEPLLELKEQNSRGLVVAEKWIRMNNKALKSNLKTSSSKVLLSEINKSDPDRWHLKSGSINNLRK